MTNYDYGARIYNPGIGRWLAIDPKQRKYPGLSPYNFVANMPIKAIDPDGKDIIILGSVEYRTAVIEVLRELYYRSPTARKAILALAKSSDVFFVVENTAEDIQYIPFGSEDSEGLMIFNIEQSSEPLPAGNGRNGKELSSPSIITFAHELGHMYADNQKTDSYTIGARLDNPNRKGDPIDLAEVDNLDFENLVRAELGEELRTDYGGVLDIFNLTVSKTVRNRTKGENVGLHVNKNHLLKRGRNYKQVGLDASSLNSSETGGVSDNFDFNFTFEVKPYNLSDNKYKKIKNVDVPKKSKGDKSTTIK